MERVRIEINGEETEEEDVEVLVRCTTRQFYFIVLLFYCFIVLFNAAHLQG